MTITPSDLKSPNTVVEYHTLTKNEYFIPCFSFLPSKCVKITYRYKVVYLPV